MRTIDKEKVKEKIAVFWNIMGITSLRVRVSRGTAAVQWAEGNFIDIEYLDNIYYVDVHKDDLHMFKRWLRANKIAYVTGTNEELKKMRKQRPLIMLTPIEEFSSEIRRGFPTMPLKEFVEWCKGKQPMESILEYADLKYDLGLGIRCSDEETRAIMEKFVMKQRNKEKRKAERLLKMFRENSEQLG